MGDIVVTLCVVVIVWCTTMAIKNPKTEGANCVTLVMPNSPTQSSSSMEAFVKAY